MKRLTAILLLTLFLINLVGYRGWFYLAERQWETHIQLSLDKDQFNDEDLIMIKAPLMLPYVTDTKDFVRTDGEINIKGKIYRYVKSKVENGEYILMCLPDHYKEKLENAKHDYFKDANDLMKDSKNASGGKAGPFKFLPTEYDTQNFQFYLTNHTGLSSQYAAYLDAALHSSPHISPEHPPELMS